MAMGIWEGVGQVTGTWLGMTIWAAGAVPVGATDGPLPIMDLAWVAANYKNTQRLRKGGGAIGAGIDEYLAGGSASTPGESWGTPYVAPETSSKTDSALFFNELPEGSGIQFGSFLSFGPIEYDFSHLNFTPATKSIQDLTYIYRNSQWPSWND